MDSIILGTTICKRCGQKIEIKGNRSETGKIFAYSICNFCGEEMAKVLNWDGSKKFSIGIKGYE